MKNKTQSSYITGIVLAIFLSSCSDGSSQTQIAPVIGLEEQIKTKFNGEVLPPVTSSCFAGAYYRKAVSSKDFWIGIGGTIVLPTLTYDLSRENPNRLGTYLDNASIYLGGTSDDQETDIGMTWEVIKDAAGNVSKDRKAFRPFLRRTAHKSGQTLLYKNAPATSNYYWYPGETIAISIELVEDKKFKFIVDGAGKRYEEIFEVDGYRKEVMANYKRVNAIDQVSNEGKPVQSTTAKVTGAKWLDVYLLRNVNTQVVKAPMHSKRFTDMQCPAKSYFILSASGESAESIDIFGTK